jgi:hypothetical protein
MSLETKHYVATLEDVADITREIISAQKAGAEGRATYLRVLIATTQSELGQHPRQRTVDTAKLSDAERETQLAALETVGKRFYDVVTKAAKALIDGPDRGGLELNRRTTFARTSLSAIRRWVTAGNDITNLAAGRTTKASLVVAGRRKAPTAKVLSNQTKRYAARLERTLATLAITDRETALRQWERLKAHMEKILRRRSKAQPA